MATQTTGGGSTTSFNNTPQAQGDTYGWTEEQLLTSGIYDAATCTIALNVMANDLGGKAKTLWSIDDGGSNFMSELLQSNITTSWETTAEGNWIRICNGKIEFRIGNGSNSPEGARSVDSLSEGECIQDSFYYSIRLSNGTLSYAKVTLDIVGQNDQAALVGTSTGSVIEAGGTNNGDPGSPTAAGTLKVNDVDTGQNHFQAPQESALNGTYGRFNFDATTGAWTYALDNACAATQALTAGQVVTETLTVWSADGTASRDIVITVTGANDQPAVSAAVAASHGEDEAGFSVDLLAGASDADASDVLHVADLTPTGGDASGVTVDGDSLSVDPSAYTYLAVGESAVITYSYNVIDGHGGSVAQTATITVTGANDQPVNTIPGAQTVGSNTATAITGVAVADVDSTNVTTTLSVSSGKLTVGTVGGFTVNNNGTNTVTISGTLAQVNAALATLSYLSNTNYSGADTLTVITSDGLLSDTDTVAITVNPPANAAPAASNDVFVISTGTSVSLSAAWLLSNDTDTDGDALSISESSIVGSLPNGWTITPVTAGGVITGFDVSTGNVNQAATLSYTVDDGQGHTSTAQFTIQTPSTVSNGGKNEIDLGSLSYNYSYLDGKDHNDSLTANLTLTGTQGNDVFVGSDGNDILDAGAGHNVLTGGTGNDTFVFRNFASTTNHIADFDPGTNSTTVDTLHFEVGTGANEFSVGNNDAIFIFKTGNNATINVAGTEIAVKTDASVTNATVQSTISSYGNITTGAFFVFHNTDLGHGAVYYDPNPSAAGGAVIVAELDNITLLGNLGNFNANDFLLV